MKSDWGSGYCADIMVSNQGASAVNSWSLTLDKKGQSIQGWNFAIEDRGADVVLKPIADWNSTIAAGESKKVGGFCVYQGAQAKMEIKAVQ